MINLINSKENKAFTLAEVLITLGIIGVVAALTIPTLMNKVNKQQYVVGLKKSYLTLTNGFKSIMADEGVTNFGDTSLFDGNDFYDSAKQDKIDVIMKKYFKIIKSCKSGDASCTVTGYKELGTSKTYNSFQIDYDFCLADGMCAKLALSNSCQEDNSISGKMKANCGNIWIDINGQKSPNQAGRDNFLFYIAQDGNVYPAGGEAISRFVSGDSWTTSTSYWKTSTTAWPSCGSLDGTSVTGSTGYGCAGRIMEDSWQMNY